MLPTAMPQPLVVPEKIDASPMTTLSDWLKLSKAHLSLWVALSALPGYLVCAPFDPVMIGGILTGTALASASSQALNQIYERDRDGRMARTRNRPIPTGRISVSEARVFAIATALSGSTILTAVSGSLAPAAIAISTIALYVNVYTPMKTKSCYNTHVGAIAGSLPVMIGFACAGGFDVFLTSSAPWIFFSIQTLWQFPHFYPLAWMYREDYTAGGYRMFPLGDETGKETAKICGPYMAALTAVPFLSSAIGATTWMFPITGSVVNALWGQQYMRFVKNPTKANARTYFLGSLWYLMLMMGAFVLHLKPQKLTKDGSNDPFDWRLRLKKQCSKLCIHESATECNVPSLCPVDNSRNPT
jgi:protoheme IX farnesyltransferase